MRLIPSLRALAPILLALATAPALAQDKPRSMADCERIKGDLAYNQCLASFGPAAGLRAPRGGPDVDPGLLAAAEEDEKPVVRRGRRSGGRTVARTRSGRQSATFVITRGAGVGKARVSGSRKAYRSERRYRRRR